MSQLVFRSRKEAGQLLAGRLASHGYAQPVVLALPRGGAAVGVEIARHLGCALDSIVVQGVIMAPHPGRVVGAVAEDGEVVLDRDGVAALGLDARDLADVMRCEGTEAARRAAFYRDGRAPADIAARTAIVVDDGASHPSLLRAALRSVRRRKPKRLVLALPVATRETLRELAQQADEVSCLIVLESSRLAAEAFESFDDVTEEEARALVDLGSRG